MSQVSPVSFTSSRPTTRATARAERPDTSGPVYQPIAWSESDKINAALKSALDKSTDSADEKRAKIQVQTKILDAVASGGGGRRWPRGSCA